MNAWEVAITSPSPTVFVTNQELSSGYLSVLNTTRIFLHGGVGDIDGVTDGVVDGNPDGAGDTDGAIEGVDESDGEPEGAVVGAGGMI